MLMPILGKSKGWTWFWLVYFSFTGIFLLIFFSEVFLFYFTGTNLFFEHLFDGHNPDKRINTLGDWVRVVILFFYLFSTLIFMMQVMESWGKLCKEGKWKPRFESLCFDIQWHNWASPLVSFLLAILFLFTFFPLVIKGLKFIPSDWEINETYLRIGIFVAFIFGIGKLGQWMTLWIDRQKPALIYTALGVVFFLFFGWFVRLVNGS